MKRCGFSKSSAQKDSQGNPFVQKLKAGLPTGLLLQTALKILLAIHCCFREQVINKVSKGFLKLKN
jgi:hypothetical protein